MQTPYRAVAVLALAAGALGAAPARGAAPRLTLSPCTLPGVQGEARCGTWEVPENRSAPNGRKVSLRVAVLPATGGERAPDPIVPFAGGPGESAVESAGGIAYAHAAL